MAADDSPVERTADGRYIVVNGRRWRASDPAIPEKLRVELVAELMDARRAVGRDEDGARARVDDAKHALGERGAAWWEPMSEDALGERAQAALRSLLRRRGSGSVCPSEVARIAAGDSWRSKMPVVRAAAAALEADDIVIFTQRGERVQPETARGPVRIARAARFDIA